MDVDDFVTIIPQKYKTIYRNKLKDTNNIKYPTMSEIKLKSYEAKLLHPQQYLVYSKHNPSQSPQLLLSKSKVNGHQYISSKRKSCTTGRPSSYDDVNEVIHEILVNRWNEGNPLTKEGLYTWIKQKYSNVECRFTNNVLRADTYPNSLHVYIHIILIKLNFSARKCSISQKIPQDWKSLAIKGAKRIRDRFVEEDVDIVLSADETF